ncbi:MAG: HAD-IIB family hydrolase [Deltaproteobacteria bacterium]|nr:HAD-IIB family hydrolase [Deltaproteobacteria bacterium]
MNEKIIIFTDLDGTLLDHYTYSYSEAEEALKLLKEKNVPLILCSSKTRDEIDVYRKKLSNNEPLISENGGAIFIQENYEGLKCKFDKDVRLSSVEALTALLSGYFSCIYG